MVEIFTCKMGISTGCFDLKDALLDGENRNIKGTTTQVKNEHIPLTTNFFVQSISDSCSGGFFDYAKNIETSNTSCLETQSSSLVSPRR